jgi:sodium/potassium/calcium exchanger 6
MHDLCFILALCYLLAVLVNGEITIWVAASFVYVVLA